MADNNGDTISRASLLSKFDGKPLDQFLNLASIKNIIKDEEPVDAVRVTRCKDCKFFCNVYCFLGMNVNSSGDCFCSYGRAVVS